MICLLCDAPTNHGICDQCWNELQVQQHPLELQDEEFYSSQEEDADSAGQPTTCPRGARKITKHTIIPF